MKPRSIKLKFIFDFDIFLPFSLCENVFNFVLLLFNDSVFPIAPKKPIVICGEVSFPEPNWKTLYSPNETEDKVMEIVEEKKRQLIDIPTGGNNFVDTAFYQNCHQCAVLDKSFPSIYNLTGHEAIRLFLESPVTEIKQLLKNFKKFGNADYNAINALFVEKTVPSKSLHQHQQNEWRIHMVCWRTVWFTICKRTRHRQSLPPWISWYFKYD